MGYEQETAKKQPGRSEIPLGIRLRLSGLPFLSEGRLVGALGRCVSFGFRFCWLGVLSAYSVFQFLFFTLGLEEEEPSRFPLSRVQDPGPHSVQTERVGLGLGLGLALPPHCLTVGAVYRGVLN